MKKLAIIAALCILMFALPVAYAKSVPAFGHTTPSVAKNVRVQTLKIGGTFTRDVVGVRHIFTLRQVDIVGRKITFDDRYKGKVDKIVVPYDTNNKGMLTVNGKVFIFTVDPKRVAIIVAYGY